MSDELVNVPGRNSDNAVLLLEAAQKLKLPKDVVRTTTDGFEVPKKVADKAGVKYLEAADQRGPRDHVGSEPLDPEAAREVKAAKVESVKKPSPGNDKE